MSLSITHVLSGYTPKPQAKARPRPETDTAPISEEAITETEAATVELSEAAKDAEEDPDGHQGTETAVDADGKAEAGSGKVGINAGKLARMLAAAKTKAQVRAVIAKIQQDLKECEAGKAQGMDVDEASVRAARSLLSQAQQRMGEAANREATPEEEMAFSLAGLM